ncbi:MAG: Maf family protein, partial [Bacilli bacterium]
MIILASKSLRRQELLRLVGLDFKIVESNFDESTIKNVDPQKIPLLEAENKAKVVAKDYENDIVIGADTGVLIENTLLGKPKDKDDAYRMLKMLSGKTHKVITGVTIISPKKTYKINSISKVTFYDLSDEEIYHYISLE